MEINEEDKTVGQALNTVSRGICDKVFFSAFFVLLTTHTHAHLLRYILFAGDVYSSEMRNKLSKQAKKCCSDCCIEGYGS